MQIEIRAFKSGDEKAVIRLWHDCGLVVPDNDPLKDIQRKQGEHPELFLVAVGDGEIVGTVMGGYEGHRGWVNYLAVAPIQRKTGIGKMLMKDIEARLLKMGCPKINLQVRETNADVRTFYEKIGYAQDKVISYGKRLIKN